MLETYTSYQSFSGYLKTYLVFVLKYYEQVSYTFYLYNHLSLSLNMKSWLFSQTLLRQAEYRLHNRQRPRTDAVWGPGDQPEVDHGESEVHHYRRRGGTAPVPEADWYCRHRALLLQEKEYWLLNWFGLLKSIDMEKYGNIQIISQLLLYKDLVFVIHGFFIYCFIMVLSDMDKYLICYIY